MISGKVDLNTGAPHRCFLSPLLFTLFTNDCRSSDESVLAVTFSDDTTVSGFISDCDERKYRQSVDDLVSWCETNNLLFNVSKTNEIEVDFQSHKNPTFQLKINNKDI